MRTKRGLKSKITNSNFRRCCS